MLNNYTLVIDGTHYYMNDTHEDDYCFNYILAYVIPDKKLEQFNNKITNLNKTLKDFMKTEQDFGNILQNLINSKDEQTIGEYAKLLTMFSLENNVKVFRSNDHKTFLEKAPVMNEKIKNTIETGNIVNIYNSAFDYLSDMFDEDFSLNIYCDESLKTYIESTEIPDVAKINYFKSGNNISNEITNCLCLFNNYALESSNIKLYSSENFNNFNEFMLNIWANYLFKIYYDKYEKVRGVAIDVTNFLLDIKEQVVGNTNIKVSDD